jgi:hypothetical protein
MGPIIDGMDLVGAWLRQLLRAGTAAALLPIAMVASLVVVVAGAGGLGGLGALSQLVTGPEISPAQAAAAAGPRERDLALVAPPALVASVRPAAAPPAGVQPALPPAPRKPVPPPPAPPPAPRVPPPPVPAQLAPSVPPPPVAAPAAKPTLRERTGKLIEQLNRAVGEAVDAVEGIIDGLRKTLGGILDGPPRRSGAATG